MQLIMFKDDETNELTSHVLSTEIENLMYDSEEAITEERDGWLTKYPNVFVRTVALAFEKDGERILKQVSAPMDIFEGDDGERSLEEILEKLKSVTPGYTEEYEIVGAWDVTKSYIENRRLGYDFSINLDAVIKDLHVYGMVTDENREIFYEIERSSLCVMLKVGVVSVDGDEVLEFLIDQPFQCTILGYSSCLYVYIQALQKEIQKAVDDLNKRINFVVITFY